MAAVNMSSMIENTMSSLMNSTDNIDSGTNNTSFVSSEACNETYNQMQMMQQMGSEESSSADMFRFIIYGVFLTTVGLLGLAGNMISIFILSRPKMRSSINCCLIGLTCFDMIVTFTSLLMFGFYEICEFTHSMKWYSTIVYFKTTPFVYGLGLIAQTGSVYLTVTVTLERYVAVCLPFRARTLCTYGRAKIYVIIVAVFSITYNLPRFWEISYEECHVNGVDFPLLKPTPELRQDPYYKKIYIMWMYFLIMYLIPFLTLIFFNSFIYKQVRQANQERQRLSRSQKKEIGLAVMLLVVVMVFFVCNVLAFIINALELWEIQIDHLTVTSNLLVTINSSVNFIIYCIFAAKFRKLFLKMFCSKIMPTTAGRGHGNDSMYVNSSVYGGGEHRTLTNGRATETIRLSSWSDNRQSHLLHPNDANDSLNKKFGCYKKRNNISEF